MKLISALTLIILPRADISLMSARSIVAAPGRGFAQADIPVTNEFGGQVVYID